MNRAPVRPSDIARWMFWVPLRERLNPEAPERLNRLLAAWPLHYAAARSNHPLMENEYRRWFGSALSDPGYRTLIRQAYRSAWRVHLEELLLSQLDANSVERWVRINGLHHAEAALARGQGAVMVYPHAGPVMLMIAALAHRGLPYVQYAARGLAPEAIANAHPDLLPVNRWTQAVRDAREAHENALPVEYLTLDAPVRSLHRCLADNRIVGLAFDGRIGSGWFPAPFLNRTALLSRGPWKLATATNAAVLPVFCHTPHGEPAQVEIGAPIEPGKDWRALAQTVLPVHEQWLRKHPEEYGLWLLHTRQRAAIDDHPFFVDAAPDDRHKRWLD